MKRRAIAAATLAALALTGCGNSKDFTVEVARGADVVRGQIAAIDGSMLAMAGMKPFTRAKDEEPGTYRFTFPAEQGWSDGEVVLWVADAGQGRSRVDVAVDLPQIIHGDKILSDDKAEDALQEAMRDWAAKLGNGGSGADEIRFVFTGFAIASQAWSKDDMPDLPGGMASGGGFGGGFDTSRFDEGSIDPGSGSAPSFGKPMSNPRGDHAASSFGRPQNDLDSRDGGYGSGQRGGGWGDEAQ